MISYKKILFHIVTNRVFILLLTICFGYIFLFQRLFTLQIVLGEHYATEVPFTVSRIVVTDAVRGNIYDRYGRPLAVHNTVYAVYYDSSVNPDTFNEVLNSFLSVMEKSSIQYIDNLPITKEAPYSFTFPSAAREQQWKKDMGFTEKLMQMDAGETYLYLMDFFDIGKEIPSQRVRDVISLRTSIYLQRYNQQHLICLAEDIPDLVIAELEEQYEKYPGFLVTPGTVREYPYGAYASHVVGYLHTMNEDEWAYYSQYGYAYTDKIGKTGIEKTFELELSGEKGQRILEATPLGRVVRQLDEIPAEKGQDIFLTLDMELQVASTKIVQQNLQEDLLKKYRNGQYTTTQLVEAMVESNYISVAKIVQVGEMPVQNKLCQLLAEQMPVMDVQAFYNMDSDDTKQAKQILLDIIKKGQLPLSEWILLLAEQDKILLSQEEKVAMEKSSLGASDILIKKIETGEIPVHAFNLDPCTGSVVVLDVNNGQVLTLVAYPSYDNNRFVNTFDYEYYLTLLHDPTTPLINRPLMERKAPGSTFKMLSAIVALEEGIINPDTLISDGGIYTKAGVPYAKCLIYSRSGGTHGAINVAKAIEVSCNYFFYETAYRMANSKDRSTKEGMAVFNRYMADFGLDAVSGVEIEEYAPQMATLEFKEKIIGESWQDGDTIRSAIGQSVNNYTAIHMAKYIGTLANGGSRYKTSLIYGARENFSGGIEIKEAVLEDQLLLEDKNLQAVYDGMLGVTEGSQGTLRHVFSDTSFQVAGKSGTAEEANNRPAHSWFTGFAPFEEPQIAVVVLIPFGEDSASIETKIAKEIMEAYLLLDHNQDKKILDHSLAR